MSVRQIERPDQPDFQVYLTAAQLVRQHQSIDIYNEADTGQNPQLHWATQNSKFLQSARRIGITGVRLYVYPPTLADAIVPLTFLSLNKACDVWLALNILEVALAGLLLAWMFNYPIFSWQAALLVAGVLFFRTNLWALYWGQASAVLFLLWTAGIVFYGKGMKRVSAICFAVATAIKLTPLLVLLPFLFWREWRWSRWFLGSLVAIALLLCLINGPATLLDYSQHVVPSMSAGIASLQNTSLPAALQLFWFGLHGGDPDQMFIDIPHAVVSASKLAALLVLAVAALFVYRLGPAPSRLDRAKVLAIIATLSLYISPVSWRHAYTVALLLLLLLWREAFTTSVSNSYLALLTVATIEFSFVIDSLLTHVTHGALLSAVPLVAPLCGLTLIFRTLAEMDRSHRARSHRAPATAG